MSKYRLSSKASEIAYTEKFFEINTDETLSSALSMMANDREIYRLTIVDSTRNVKGVLSGLRILEILSGRRGEAIKKSTDEKFGSLLKEPITLFVEGYLHKLSNEISLTGLISYIMENSIGHVILVDQTNTLSGIVTEGCILKRLRFQDFPIKISDIMTPKVYSVTLEHTIFDSINMMSSHNIRRLPIIDNSKVKGIVTVIDLIKHLSSSLRSLENLENYRINKLMQEPLKKINLKQTEILHSDDNLKILQHKNKYKLGFPILGEDNKIVGIVCPRDLVTKVPRLIGVNNFVKLIQ